MKKINILNIAMLSLILTACNGTNDSDYQISNSSSSLENSSVSNEETNSQTSSNESSIIDSISSIGSDSNLSTSTTNFNKEDIELIKKYFSITVPFMDCEAYFLTDYTEDIAYPYVLIDFFTVEENTYTSYRNILSSSFNYDGFEVDEDDGLTYYYYSQDDTYIDISYDDEEVYLAIYKVDLSDKTQYTDEDAAILKSLFKEYTIPFLPCKEYTLSNDTEGNLVDVSFYFNVVNNADVVTFVNKLKAIFTTTKSEETSDDSYTFELAKGDINAYVYYYTSDLYSYVIMEIYHKDVYGEEDPDTPSDNDNVITNKGKGLPTSSTGVYDVDFAKNNVLIKNVTELSDYADGCPTTGSPSVLVIPVQFKDVLASSKGYTIENIKNAFYSSSKTKANLPYYSVYDYFYTSSNQKLDLNIDILDEWFTPANNSSYYENKTITIGTDTITAGEQYVMNEALSYLDKQGVDLSKYDSDNNGTIDAIVLINTLEIDETAENVFHWAFRYWNYLSDKNDEYYEYDGVYANDYLWCSYQFLYENDYGFNGKNPTNTYTFIHEFSHILGADDYYDTTGKNSPLGSYDVMDNSTADHSPFTKFVFGWLTTSKLIVADDSITLDLKAFEETGDTILIANNFDETLGMFQEYYIVTYYNNTKLNANPYGNFDSKGVVVYHINASLIKETYEGYGDYYAIYNTNTDSSDDYGTIDNLIEYVKNGNNYVFGVNDTLSNNIKDDQGNTISYSFTINSMDDNKVNITFNKN